jgi:hypothetical protein
MPEPLLPETTKHSTLQAHVETKTFILAVFNDRPYRRLPMLSRFTIVAQLWQATNAAARGSRAKAQPMTSRCCASGWPKRPTPVPICPLTRADSSDSTRDAEYSTAGCIGKSVLSPPLDVATAVARAFFIGPGWARPCTSWGARRPVPVLEVLEDPRRHTVSLPRG